MSLPCHRLTVVVPLVLFSLLALPSFAQQPVSVPNTKDVIGLAGVKNKTKGTVTVDKGFLHFTHSKVKAELATATMTDVITGEDSQRAIGGAIGTLTMFAPYGGGRFLSLFRTKLDTLTIEYRDDAGGLHGVIFTMPVGKAEAVKKELVAQGVPTSIPIQAETSKPPSPTGEKP
jgi:hypothetical protein